jgi:hypothetical protein
MATKVLFKWGSSMLVVTEHLIKESTFFADATQNDDPEVDLSDLSADCAQFCIRAIAAKGVGIGIDIVWNTRPVLDDLIPVAKYLQVKFILDKCTEVVDESLATRFDVDLFRVAEKHLTPPSGGWRFIREILGPRKRTRLECENVSISKATVEELLSRF